MRTSRAIILFTFLLLAATPARGRVFLQWTEPAIPSATAVGVKELVIPWGPGKIQLMNAARKRGYRVFAEVKSQDAAVGADAAAANGLAGIIVESDSNEPDSGTRRKFVQRLRQSYPKLSVLELNPGGKRPQIQGSLVIKRNGVLGATSPTRKPWIDSNVALMRLERALQPEQLPLFSFAWDLITPLEQQEGPRSADYVLAVAEAGAMSADVILPVHPKLQRALAEGNRTAWREWDHVKTYISFYSKISAERREPLADVAIVTDNYEATYEAMNLLARHNIPFVVFRPHDITAGQLSRFQLVVVFSKPGEQAARVLLDFSSAGGTVVLVNQQGPFPWDRLPAVKMGSSTAYQVGRGEVVDFAEPVGDPEEFAQTVRGLLNKQSVLIYLWNALTTLGFPYTGSQAGSVTLELVNYAQEPLQIQVRVKGTFSNIRYETPEHGLYPHITPEHKNGFTEFVLPDLRVGGRVYLSRPEKYEK